MTKGSKVFDVSPWKPSLRLFGSSAPAGDRSMPVASCMPSAVVPVPAMRFCTVIPLIVPNQLFSTVSVPVPSFWIATPWVISPPQFGPSDTRPLLMPWVKLLLEMVMASESLPALIETAAFAMP